MANVNYVREIVADSFIRLASRYLGSKPVLVMELHPFSTFG